MLWFLDFLLGVIFPGRFPQREMGLSWCLCSIWAPGWGKRPPVAIFPTVAVSTPPSTLLVSTGQLQWRLLACPAVRALLGGLRQAAF